MRWCGVKDKVGYEPPQKEWMKIKAVQERIMAAKEKLVQEKILAPVVLSKSVVPKSAHEDASFDWRYWSTMQLFNP